jgi:diguanylate cyclase (GGDEF)-like protein
LAVPQRSHAGLHSHPASSEDSEKEVRQLLALPASATILRIEDEDAFAGQAADSPMVRSIDFGGEIVAQLAVSTRGSCDLQDRRILDVVARELGGPLRMAMLVEDAQRAATTDPLTGIMNRRALLAALDMEQSRSERHGYPMSLLLLDVDHFKSINDEHGHATGDRVLMALGRLLSTCARKTDLVGRWGGEEFVIVLAGAAEDGARIFSERLRKSVEDLEVLSDRAQKVPVRISIGVAFLEVNDTADALIGRADRAMYEAKTSGRNRVVLSATVVRRTGAVIAIPEQMR